MFYITGRNGLTDSQQFANENKIEIVESVVVEIPSHPADLDATLSLKKIKDSGEALEPVHLTVANIDSMRLFSMQKND